MLFQLRRVTFWTKDERELQEVKEEDEEGLIEEEDEEELIEEEDEEELIEGVYILKMLNNRIIYYHIACLLPYTIYTTTY